MRAARADAWRRRHDLHDAHVLIGRTRPPLGARDLMRAEGLAALLVYGEHEDVPAAPFAPDVYVTNDRPGTIVMFVGDDDPLRLAWSPMHVNDHIEAVVGGEDDPIELNALTAQLLRA